MSLRWRLSLALALLAGLVTIATATIAYASTREQLNAENDRFLAERSAAGIQGQPRGGVVTGGSFENGGSPVPGAPGAVGGAPSPAGGGSGPPRSDERSPRGDLMA